MSIRQQVRDVYSEVADEPSKKQPFPCGEWFAASVGYPQEVLDALPDQVKASFTGVSNIAIVAEISECSTVLDLGCGAGLDSFVTAGRVGPGGHVIGLDFSRAMVRKAGASAQDLGIQNLDFLAGDAESLPIASESVDVVLVNGIFNLNLDRSSIFRELGRVVKPGGQVFAAELIAIDGASAPVEAAPENWFS